MSDFSQSNLYIDKDAIGRLISKYDDAIGKLTDMYFGLQSSVQEIADNNYWEGQSYESFKTEYDKWEIEYLKRITQLVQIKDVLKQVNAMAEALITDRNNLSSSLEVIE